MEKSPTIGWILALAGCLIGPIAIYVPMLLSGWMVGTAIFSALIFRWARGEWPRPWGGTLGQVAVLMAVLVGFSAASLIWAHAPEVVVEKLPRFAALLASGLLLIGVIARLTQEEREIASRWFLWGFLFIFAVLAMERIAGAPIMGSLKPDYGALVYTLQAYNRGITVLSVLVWPAALLTAARYGKGWGIALWLGWMALVTTFTSNAAVVGLALGGIVFLAALLHRRIVALATAAAIGVAVLASPFVNPLLPDPKMLLEEWQIPRSAYARLLIWSFVSDRIEERPLLGWGFNGSRSIPGGKQQLDEQETALPLHPHNAALQWWLELGVIGALLGALLPVLLLWRLSNSRAPPGAPEIAVGALVAATCVCFFSYGIWQSSWMAALWLSGALIVSVVTARETA